MPVALVTGASSGFGEATCRKLLARGWEVYGVARRTERMRALAEVGVHTFAMDVTDDESMRTGVERVLSRAGHLEVLINNAGYGAYGAVEDVPTDEARRQFDVNVFGPARLIQLVTPAMREAGRGRIINVTSVAADIYQPLAGWYHATKAALERLSDCLRLELSPHGIDVVLVEPGPVPTEWTDGAHASLVAASAAGAYRDQAVSVQKVLDAMVRPPFVTTVDAVSDALVTAATTARPKTRYPVGPVSGLSMAITRILPDRLTDAVTRIATTR